MAKSKAHTLTIKVRFDKPCAAAYARAAVADCIHSEYYCAQYDDDQPGEFVVRKIGRLPRA